MKLYTKISTMLLISTFVFGCSNFRKREPAKKSGQAAVRSFEQAKRKVSGNQVQQGLKDLDRIAKENQDSEIAAEALYLKGQTQAKIGSHQQAIASFAQVYQSDFTSPREPDALVGAAKSLSAVGRIDEAVSLTDRLLNTYPDSKGALLEAYRLRLNLFSQIGSKLQTLESYAQLATREPDPKKKATHLSAAQEIIKARLNERELETVSTEPRFGFLQGSASFTLAENLMAARKFGAAKAKFKRVVLLNQNAEQVAMARQSIAKLDTLDQVNPKSIGVILPMSGRHAGIGKQALQGLKLGLGIQNDAKADLLLLVRDSRDDADEARKATEELIFNERVIGIVGPLLSRPTESVTLMTQEFGVPNLILSQKSGATESGDMIFRYALTSEMIVRRLVRSAMENLGYKRFAILYPNDRYGVEYSNLFWDEVLARGGEIRAAQIYDPKTMDIRAPIQRLTGLFYQEDRSTEYAEVFRDWFSKQKKINTRRGTPDDLLQPIVDFDAVFVPDGLSGIGQIAPMFAYYRIPVVPFLGTNLWNSQTLIERGGRHSEGAVFVDGVAESDPAFFESEFFKKYVQTFGENPTLFAAQAYDAGRILRNALGFSVRTREGLRSNLARTRSFSGVLGPTDQNSFREFERALKTYRVVEGKLTTLQ